MRSNTSSHACASDYPATKLLLRPIGFESAEAIASKGLLAWGHSLAGTRSSKAPHTSQPSFGITSRLSTLRTWGRSRAASVVWLLWPKGRGGVVGLGCGGFDMDGTISMLCPGSASESGLRG